MSSAVESKRIRIQRQIENAERELARLDSLPDEPIMEGDCTVITFTRHIGSREYHYAAVRAAGQWYYTGKDRDGNLGHSWDYLMEKLTQWGIEEIWVATAWEAVE